MALFGYPGYLVGIVFGLKSFSKKMRTVLSHLRRESHGKTGKGDVMPGLRRDEMEEMEEDEMDEMDNVKSGETGAMNGVVSTRAVGKVSLIFFLQTWRPAPVCVDLEVDPLWIVILPVLQIQHVTWLTQDGIEIAS